SCALARVRPADDGRPAPVHGSAVRGGHGGDGDIRPRAGAGRTESRAEAGRREAVTAERARGDVTRGCVLKPRRRSTASGMARSPQRPGGRAGRAGPAYPSAIPRPRSVLPGCADRPAPVTMDP